MLKAALHKAWYGASTEGTRLQDSIFGTATARATLVYDVVRFFYDEAKFRTPGPFEERDELGTIVSAASGYEDRMHELMRTWAEVSRS
ncbi:hypothetical protein [Streptomyces sp. NPDC055400]